MLRLYFLYTVTLMQIVYNVAFGAGEGDTHLVSALNFALTSHRE